ncbi:hypothetical protein E2C01_053316 [Portunus trituberculatus]|uniref:Uncharacterized protein n=1 Tax=Portunus trituberculatus TaxID=210409 RepID=A0A5B7GG94_PORTR|nr:hypothetical protein [Portunus trituberculatus]
MRPTADRQADRPPVRVYHSVPALPERGHKSVTQRRPSPSISVHQLNFYDDSLRRRYWVVIQLKAHSVVI